MPMVSAKHVLSKAKQVVNSSMPQEDKEKKLKKLELPNPILNRLYLEEMDLLAYAESDPRVSSEEYFEQKQRTEVIRATMLEQMEWN